MCGPQEEKKLFNFVSLKYWFIYTKKSSLGRETTTGQPIVVDSTIYLRDSDQGQYTNANMNIDALFVNIN